MGRFVLSNNDWMFARKSIVGFFRARFFSHCISDDKNWDREKPSKDCRVRTRWLMIKP